jgi:hypothetical protein
VSKINLAADERSTRMAGDAEKAYHGLYG